MKKMKTTTTKIAYKDALSGLWLTCMGAHGCAYYLELCDKPTELHVKCESRDDDALKIAKRIGREIICVEVECVKNTLGNWVAK